MKKKCKHQTNNGWCKARGGTCIWSEYTPEACLKREDEFDLNLVAVCKYDCICGNKFDRKEGEKNDEEKNI